MKKLRQSMAVGTSSNQNLDSSASEYALDSSRIPPLSISAKSRSGIPPLITSKLMPAEVVKEDTLEDMLSPTKYDESNPGRMPASRGYNKNQNKIILTQPDASVQEVSSFFSNPTKTLKTSSFAHFKKASDENLTKN